MACYRKMVGTKNGNGRLAAVGDACASPATSSSSLVVVLLALFFLILLYSGFRLYFYNCYSIFYEIFKCDFLFFLFHEFNKKNFILYKLNKIFFSIMWVG
jgi:hypothetical protein